MSDEIEVNEVPQTAPEAVVENAPEVVTEVAEAAPEVPQAPKREPWANKRIDELTRKYRDEERRANALEALLENRSNAPAGQTPSVLNEQAINSRAQEIASSQRLMEASNAVYAAGKAAHADFDSAVQTLTQVEDLSRRPDFLEAITSLPNAADVYYALGKDPDEAAHILGLSPVKMAIELAKVSAKAARPKPQSKAPAPIEPISKTASPTAELADDLPMAEWMKRRAETARKK